MSSASYSISPRAPGLVGRLGRPRSQGLCLLVCLIALVVAGKAGVVDHLRIGCFGPLVDHLIFASIQSPWTPYSWLAELGMKALWDFGGYRAAVLAGALMQAG